VQAEAQDGAGVNNANFGTPPDGSRPRMQMFIWTAPTPDRDGDVDNGIIAHEYGHGISNRLVGGPANVSCLQNAEQPGEGLSDWWSLFYTFEASNPSVRGIGTYALFQATNGAGIRNARYDKDPEPNTNPWTYGSLPGSAIPHGVGEKWAQAFWYVQGRLEDEHGFDADVYNFTGTGADAGNVRAMFYIIEGLKNAACSPGFVDTRDGIIDAATSAYGGEDVCLLWEAFAEYGLGFSASQGSNNSINDQTPAFDLPPSCTGGPGGDYCATPALAIPDNLPAGVTNTISIADTGDILDLDVQINATHSWVGDLIFTLQHVDSGTSVTFYDRPGVPASTFGCSGDDIPGVFGDDEGADGSFEDNCLNATPAFPADGHFTGNNPLSALDGLSLAGDWTLTVSDNAGGDTGTLNEWCLVIESDPTPPTEPDIAVDPTDLSSTQEVDTQVVVQLDITNNGDADLDWTIEEAEGLGTRSVRSLPRRRSGPFRPYKQTVHGDAANEVGSGTQDFSRARVGQAGLRVTPPRPEAPVGAVTITHSASQAITALNSVSCNAGGLHTDNSYVRRFTLGDFGITSDFQVQQVEVGVETATGTGGTQPVTVNLYTWDPSDPFTFANFTEIGTADVSVPDQSATILTVPVTGTAPAGSTLVVELFTPNGQTAGHSFFVGSNADGQTDASFLAAADCGVAEPTDTAVLGFPNMHVVMNVTGIAGGCGDDLTWVSTSPSAGTTVPLATSTVDVTFDSTGLDLGQILLGSLCIDSNDPDSPTVLVPLTLEVDTMPFLDGFESGDTSEWSASQL
jgi:subtilisin-like proprotein convertase family protein